MLGISRRKIQYRLKEWGVTADEIEGRGADGSGGTEDREAPHPIRPAASR